MVIVTVSTAVAAMVVVVAASVVVMAVTLSDQIKAFLSPDSIQITPDLVTKSLNLVTL